MRKALRFVAPLMLAAPFLMAAGGPATATVKAVETVEVECATMCTKIYDPVECQLSDGTTQTFGNSCEAKAYACQHGLTIVSCRSAGSGEPPD